MSLTGKRRRKEISARRRKPKVARRIARKPYIFTRRELTEDACELTFRGFLTVALEQRRTQGTFRRTHLQIGIAGTPSKFNHYLRPQAIHCDCCHSKQQ